MRKLCFILFVFPSIVEAQFIDSNLVNAAPQFSGQVAVCSKDSVLYSFYKGYANYELRIPIKSNYTIELADLSMLFTIEACQDLINKKILHPDSSVSFYLKKFPYKEMKIKHLIDQSSGLPSNYIKLYHRNIYDDQNIKMKDKTSIHNSEIIKIIEDKKPILEFVPGEKKVLSKTNFIILAQIIELLYETNYEIAINRMIAKKYPTLHIFDRDQFYGDSLFPHISGLKKTGINEYITFENLSDLGYKYNDYTYGQQHIFGSATDLALYFEMNKEYFSSIFTSPISGYAAGFHSTLYYDKNKTIVILSNTSDEYDNKLLLKELTK